MRFEALYERMPPWEIGGPQPAFVALAEQGRITGTVLDVGCGTGDNALCLAGRGLDVWGVDIVDAAIGMARDKARARGLPAARFLVADALSLADLGVSFDTVTDSGLFHALSDEERPLFLDGLDRVLAPGGLYHMLGFSDREPGSDGPRRLSEAEIRATFSRGFRVAGLEEAVFMRNSVPRAARAWLLTAERFVAGKG